MLLNSKEILKIESRFSSLIERTFFKGTLGQRAPKFKDSVSYWFKSKTFKKQIDSIIDDTCLFSAVFTDKQIKKSLKASSHRSPPRLKLSAADNIPLPITEEVVRQAKGLAVEVADSIVTMLTDDGLYQEAPATLERLVRDLWGGEKYRATRFVRTFTADLATNTAVYRYKQNEVDMQFYAKIDEKTSPQCRMLHGTIFKFGSPEISLYRCPLHHFCRSALIPYPSSLEMDTDLLFENRNFAKQMNQDFSFSENIVDPKIIKTVFEDIGIFNEKYRIDQFIFDADIEKRLIKLGVGVKVDIMQPISNYPMARDVIDQISKAHTKLDKQIDKIVTRRLELRDKRYDIADAYEKGVNKAAVDFNAGRITLEEYNNISNTQEMAWNEISKIDQEIEKLTKKQYSISGSINNEIHKLLYINDGEASGQFLNVSSGADKSRLQQSKETLAFFNKTLTKELRESLPKINVIELEKGGRAYTMRNSNSIWLNPEDSSDVMIHELGHNLEYNSAYIRDSANKHFTKRAIEEKTEKLRDATGLKFYNEDEITKKDKFFDPYVGKVNKDGSTELTSMALQYLYKDPNYLLRKDPELFEWIVNIVRGHYD